MSKYILLFAMVSLSAKTTALASNTTANTSTRQEVRIGNLPAVPGSVIPPKLVRFSRPAYTERWEN